MSDHLIQIRSNLAVVQDHSRQFADFTFVYPVISRRARGLSIGINLNPDKVCNFDCVYCEVDRTTPGKVSRMDLNQMRDELKAMIHFVRDGGLAKEPRFDELPSFITRNVKDIAFSGDGEPTLIHNFAECVQVVAEVKRDERLAKTRIVLITDAAGLDKADVKRGLEIMDINNGEVYDFQAAFHVGLVETGSVRDENDSSLSEAFVAFHLSHNLDALGEVVDQGWLAVTAESNVLDVARDERRQFVEPGFLGQSAVAHEMNHRLQLVAHLVQIHP